MNSRVTGEGDVVGVVQKTTLQFLPKIVTFKHRHENKSCSACRERVNERAVSYTHLTLPTNREV